MFTPARALRALLSAESDSALAVAVETALGRHGWDVARIGSLDEPDPGAPTYDALVHVPSFVETGVLRGDDVATSLATIRRLVESCTALEDGGARLVVLTSRDWLGWSGRADIAAASAGVVAASRSLALELGPRGVACNAVVRLPELADPAAEPSPVTPAPYPGPLLAGGVGDVDVAEVVAFLAHPRASYITGQTVHATGGASLLSSLSA